MENEQGVTKALTDTILIVDDSSFIVEGLVAILKKSYRPLAVYGGQQCLDILRKEKPSIIILDIMMEPMDGWETLTRIKENPDTRNIPVLMFSAKKISAQEAEEHRINIDDFVTKPVTPKKLIEAIEKVLSRQKANQLSIESWRSAGIGQDRIDEYTSLMTSLEVDMSLLQNMKVQLSLVHEEDERIRTDLEAVIAAIEGRIQEERQHQERLSLAMQESVSIDAEAKERAGPVAVLNESGQENLPVEEGTTSAVQPEPSHSGNIADGETHPLAPEGLVKEVDVSYEMTPTDLPNISEVPLPNNSLPEADFIPDITGSFQKATAPQESSLDVSEMKNPVQLPVSDPESDLAHSRPALPTELSEPHHVTQPLPAATTTGTFVTGADVSVDEKVPPVSEQKIPFIREPRPFTARTLDNKPVAPDAPIPRAIGSGTDTSSGWRPYSVDRSRGNSGAANREKSVPVKDVTSPSAGLISRIISTILHMIKR